MTTSRRLLGRLGEELAVEYLTGQGLRIAGRNVRLRGGELDIVAWDQSILVFVEVRSRRSDRMGTPFESVDIHKRRRLARLAHAYLHLHGLHDVDCRFDVVGVTWSTAGSPPRIHHLRNAFSV